MLAYVETCFRQSEGPTASTMPSASVRRKAGSRVQICGILILTITHRYSTGAEPETLEDETRGGLTLSGIRT